MGARKPKKDDPIAKMIIGRENSRCMIRNGSWGDQDTGRCSEKGECWLDDDGQYVIACEPHRKAGLGLTSGEKTKRRRDNREAQVELMPGLLDKKSQHDG